MFLKSDTTAEDVSKIKKELEGVSNIENSTIEFKSKADSALELKNGNDIFATTVDKWTDDTNPLLDSYMFIYLLLRIKLIILIMVKILFIK